MCESPGKETCRLRPSPEPVQDSVSAPSVLEPELVHPSQNRPAETPFHPCWSRSYSILPRTGQQKHRSFCAKAGRSCPRSLRKPVTIMVPIYGFACQQFHPRSRRIVSALRHKQKIVSRKSIHTANEEEQVKICRKLKEFLVIRLAVTQCRPR
jgi:hypothetical protein